MGSWVIPYASGESRSLSTNKSTLGIYRSGLRRPNAVERISGILQSLAVLVDMRGLEPAAPRFASRRKFDLSRCLGCVYPFEGTFGESKCRSLAVLRVARDATANARSLVTFSLLNS
jgi:hypothetical protein